MLPISTLKTTYGKDIINSWLRDCWRDVTKNTGILESDEKYALNRKKITFSFVTKAFVCPITNKLIDTTFKGITLYFHCKIIDPKKYICEEVLKR